MSDNELFPLRVVCGERFCNREKERKLLKELIKQKRPTTLISPRRYGKTSLACKVTEEIKLPFCMIDFLTAYDDNSICNCIIDAISKLVSEIMPINMKTLKLLEKCFHDVKISILAKFITLEFAMPLEKADPVRQVLEVLRGLETLSGKINKTVVVFIDEFQRVLETEKGFAIQGAIRSVAQIAKNIAFLFSGSSRHMLLKAFDDSNQPLYMMCEKIFLGRIKEHDYIPYIQKAAIIKWREELHLELVQRIIGLTEEHPFYVNLLCSKLWQKNKQPISISDVDLGWHECLLCEERRLIGELDKLTLAQRLVLKEIALTSDLKMPTAANFLSKTNMSSGTVTPILKSLGKKDMIYVDENGVTKVLDPLMKYLLVSR